MSTAIATAPTAAIIVPTTAHKPGWKTSEFWLSLLTLASPTILGIAHSEVAAIPPDTTAAFVASTVLALGYQWARTHAKSANAKATVALGALAPLLTALNANFPSPDEPQETAPDAA